MTTDTTTTPEAAQVAAIRKIINDREYAYPEADLYEVIPHLDALGEALRAAEARAERLRKLVAICKREAQAREPARAYLTIDWTGAHNAAGIQPGDLDERQQP